MKPGTVHPFKQKIHGSQGMNVRNILYNDEVKIW